MALLHISPLFRFSKHYAMLRMKFGQVGSYTDLLRQGKKYFINATIIFSDPSVMIYRFDIYSFARIFQQYSIAWLQPCPLYGLRISLYYLVGNSTNTIGRSSKKRW